MKRILLLLIIIVAWKLAGAVTVEHFAPKIYFFGSDVELRMNVIDGMDQIAGTTIVYSQKGKDVWQRQKMEVEATGSYWYVGEIKASDLRDLDIEYYFEIMLADGNIVNFPDKDSLTPRYVLTPGAALGEKSDGFVLLSDEPNPGQGTDYLLAVSFFEIADTVDVSSIRVWVGGKDVTKQATITENAILYRDTTPRPGERKAMITAQIGGQPIYSDIWTTTVPPRKRLVFLPMNLRGNFSFVSNVYDYNPSANANVLEADNDLAGQLDLYGNYGILNLQGNVFMSSLEDENKQPINRYTIGMQIPLLDVFVGDYTPNLSAFTMSNKNVRGLYSRFHTKYLSLYWSGGEMVRETVNDITGIDGLNHKAGTFKQEALGARFQMGTEEGFMLGITGSRNRDIISSLSPDEYFYTTAEGDTIYTATPQDNAVLSIDMRLSIPDQNVVLGIDGAGSILNYNTLPGPITQEQLEDYLPDDFPLELDPQEYADYFILNQNMEPLMPRRENTAWQAYARMLILGNYLDARYAEVGPAFNSLSTYYQQKDTKQYSLSDQINILNTVYVSGGVNVIEDNLSGHKNETNKTFGWNAQATIRPARLPYFRAGIFNNDIENELNAELNDPSYVFNPFKRNSQSMNFGLGYMFSMIPLVPSSLDITYRLGKDDNLSGAAEILDYKNLNNSLSISINNKFQIVPLRTQIVWSLYNQKREDSVNTTIYPLYDNSNTNLFLRADYSLFKNKLRPYVQYRATSLSGDTQATQQYNYVNLGLEAYPITNMTVSTDIGKQYYNNDTDELTNYDNLTWRFKFSQRF